ncbi:hypothetical protein FNL56_13290 [Tardiphaga sp. vice304]|uniref:hypothetical protein n=1 Tax=Tardiphaga sp. vice304 TaxID=2592817 RepID=UPI001161E7F3|nr:hypothetical protein [Tardiphaga sp. vice304]QDM26975.1 hypothetical protein FNL56_13290 [Tardiphaga sp. vice304]
MAEHDFDTPVHGRLHAMSLTPVEVFSDHVQIFVEDPDEELIRLVFYATRPEAEDKLGYPTVPVARIAISRRHLEYAVSKLPEPLGQAWADIPLYADRRRSKD